MSHDLSNNTLDSILGNALSTNDSFRKSFEEKFHQSSTENLIVKSKPIDNGISNKIFTIEISTTTNNDSDSSTNKMELILKITKDYSEIDISSSSKFNKTLNEACIMKFLHASLPNNQFKSPAIYDLHSSSSSLESGELRFDYILMEKCRGIALNLIYEQLSDEERKFLITQISEMRGKLAEFKFIPKDSNGNLKETLFGSILDIEIVGDRVAHVTVGSNSDGEGPFESFNDFLIANLEKRIEDMQKDEKVSYQVHHFQQLVNYLKEKPVAIKPDLYQLCHTDLTSNNVIVDPTTNQITGIIDWEWGVMSLLDMDINELQTWTRNEQELTFLKDSLNQTIPQISKNSMHFWKEFEMRKFYFQALDWAIRLSSYKTWFKTKSEEESFIMKALENTTDFFKQVSFTDSDKKSFIIIE